MGWKPGLLAAVGMAGVLGWVGGCGGSNTAGNASSTALASTLASATDATGTLLCTPAQAQIDACTGSAAGAACTLATDADGGAATSGTCRTTLDGTTVACAPNPRAPPQALVDACTGPAAGASCTATEPDGDGHTGVCVTARDGSTLVCGRVRTPPQVAIDACSGLAAGASCTLPGNAREADAGTAAVSGVCSLGPAGTGPLACARAQELRPSATTACAGLAAGASCAIGHGPFNTSGSCVTPAAGGDAVCVVACADLGGSFRCGPGGFGGGFGPHHH